MEYRNRGHALLLPYPAQGHMKPFMKMSHLLADREIKVTLVIPKFIHRRLVSEFNDLERVKGENQVTIVSGPDGLKPGDDCKDERKIAESINLVMPSYVEGLIKEANDYNGVDCDQKITCVIADVPFGWALDIGDKLGLKRAVFFTSAPGILAMTINIPRLIESGFVDVNGSATRDEKKKMDLSPNLPALTIADFAWNFPGNPSMQKLMFYTFLTICQNLKRSDWILCNWFHDLDPAISDLVPNVLPIGPTITNAQKPSGNFWSEDLTCLNWLDQHPPNSVIYVAFGSAWNVDQNQFNELALGLQLSNRPFLWVIRSDQGVNVPDGFVLRTSQIGKIVEWAPQEAVLAHGSVACYLSRCGWNSTIEAIAMGVPLLCWPSFADQFYSKTCVCEGWKTGLWLKPDENGGIVDRGEIKMKIDELLGDEAIRENVEKWKRLAQKNAGEGGSSWKNLMDFIELIKGF